MDRIARFIACAAVLAGGAAFAVSDGSDIPGGGLAPARADVSIPLSSPSSSAGAEGAPSQPDAAQKVESRPAVSSEPSSTAVIETRPTDSSGLTPTATMETRPTMSSEPSSTAGQDVVDTMYQSVSYGFLSTATWLDSFFGNERYLAESNQSELRLRFDAFREDNTKMDFHKPDFTLRLVLPQLRKKTRLVIAGDPTTDTEATSLPSTVPPETQPGPLTSRNVGGALQYFPVESDRSNFSLRAGVKLHNSKIALLLGPRYRYLLPLDPWALRFTQEVTWSSELRWQSRSIVDLERPFSGGLFFRASFEGVWTENVHGYPYLLGFTLRQPLDPDRALLYSWINSFQTRPVEELVQEQFVFGYRQRFWKPWLFLEIDPQVRFPRDLGFAYTPGILFRLEMVFGHYGPLF